ncbi:MAG: hypothetical protein NTV98_03910, partial [Candidatus Roizmanbacteria bacterium]|nr:hypothetical protein [Candidatus Roizmanbacteria bacterium]
MNRLKFFVIFFTIFFISLALRVHPSYAQQIAGFNSDCLEATITGNFHSADLSVPTAEKRAQKGYKLPKGDGRKTWIFVCVATTHGNKCTTGNPTVDFEVFHKTADYDDILKNPNYSLKDIGGVVRGTNPIAMVGEGDPQFAQPVTWTDEYIPPTAHTWMWVQAADPVLDVSEAGAKGAQQQATFDFLHTQADSSKCTQLGWDPKGYVFDAKTLYPVKGVAITIAQKGASGLYSDMESRIGLTNPDISLDRNGQYSFFTPPGTYKLRITSSNATLAETVSINPAYKKAFTLTDPISTLYNEGQEIVEREGDVAVSHMPVIIANDDLLIKDLAVIWRKEEKSASDEIYFSGALSHPKSLIKITATYIDEDGKLFQDVSTKMTNEIGEYKFSLPQTKT